MQYTAKFSTLLKKSPVQGSKLADNEKVVVSAGKSFPVEKILETNGLHSHVKLGSEAGSWWIFLPHWSFEGSGEVKATFSLSQDSSSNLIYGELVFTEGGQEILRVDATSGQPGYQYSGAHTQKGKGCLPPGNDWKISTNGYNIDGSDQPGIDGMFYHITPDPHPGTDRGEFGLHRDANVEVYPGSAGCIVVKTSDFNGKIIPLIDGLKDTQSQIPLSVVYT
jgi:hypothetical protein